jgi:hypothetical protein
MAKEPAQLRRGKAFHKLIQAEWLNEARGDIKAERHLIKPNGRRGRVDIFVDDTDSKEAGVAVVEIKATDWDKIKPENIRRNAKRQIRQIWSYIEPHLRGGQNVGGVEAKDVNPGIIFPKRPKDMETLELVEALFWEEGIPVVWHDESVEELKARNKARK